MNEVESDPTKERLFQNEYRHWFILGAILFALTTGASWGTHLLWQIGVSQSFTATSLQSINAHGHAQIFGWIGLFLMGIVYLRLPLHWGTTLKFPHLSLYVFLSITSGIILRTAGMTLCQLGPWAIKTALLGGSLEILSIGLFVFQIVVTFFHSPAKYSHYILFIFTSLSCFFLMSLASTWHMWNTLTAPSTEDLLWYVATFQAPLRDLQIHGLILCMILGISIYSFTPLFGLAQISQRRAFLVWILVVLSLISEITLFLAYRLQGNHYYAAALLISWSLFLSGILLLLQKWKLWKRFEHSHPTNIFIKTAYGFLVISFLMLLLLPVYQRLSCIAFSHAYYGAIRHAITVGFATLMIMGMAIRLIPNAGSNTYLHGMTFLLICLGCSLRIGLQILTDWNSSAYSFIGLSGVLEVMALTLWGSHLAMRIIQNKLKMEIFECL